MLSINRFDSDAGTVINGGDSDTSMAMTEVRKGGGSDYYENQSEYSSGNVIVIGDANSSYLGS